RRRAGTAAPARRAGAPQLERQRLARRGARLAGRLSRSGGVAEPRARDRLCERRGLRDSRRRLPRARRLHRGALSLPGGSRPLLARAPPRAAHRRDTGRRRAARLRARPPGPAQGVLPRAQPPVLPRHRLLPAAAPSALARPPGRRARARRPRVARGLAAPEGRRLALAPAAGGMARRPAARDAGPPERARPRARPLSHAGARPAHAAPAVRDFACKRSRLRLVAL